MKTCIFCGRDNEDTRETCQSCASALTPADVPETDQFLPVREPPEVSRIDLHYLFENGFAYPDWDEIFEQVKRFFPESEWDAVFQEIAKRWLRELRENAGGTYRCYESENFLLLAADGKTVATTLLSYAENAFASVERSLGPLMNRRTYGKRLLLAFNEPDDYYAYISHFHAEGGHSLSAGIFLNRGYMHIALPAHVVFGCKRVIAHELVHNCIAHLRVPTWLHEGFAKRIEHLISDQRFLLDREMAERHHAHWNAGSIQEFWSGASFYGPDDGNELSYHLAEIFVRQLSEDWNAFLAFVREADDRDGGQDAAVRILGKDLGEIAGSFLGPGDWRPQRKVIAGHFARRKEPAGPDQPAPESGLALNGQSMDSNRVLCPTKS